MIMKIRILSFLVFFLLSACSFIVKDTRTPEEKATVESSRATQTATASLLSTVTPTVELVEILPAECIVKGNVSSSGEKIFHVEGQANYSRVIIDPEHGEKCFATEEEAIEAGWRKSLR